MGAGLRGGAGAPDGWWIPVRTPTPPTASRRERLQLQPGIDGRASSRACESRGRRPHPPWRRGRGVRCTRSPCEPPTALHAHWSRSAPPSSCGPEISRSTAVTTPKTGGWAPRSHHSSSTTGCSCGSQRSRLKLRLTYHGGETKGAVQLQDGGEVATELSACGGCHLLHRYFVAPVQLGVVPQIREVDQTAAQEDLHW